jgi:hypothetical protein
VNQSATSLFCGDWKKFGKTRISTKAFPEIYLLLSLGALLIALGFFAAALHKNS